MARDMSNSGGGSAAAPLAARGGFFRIYKRGQGRHTRLGTVLGAAVLGLAGAAWLFGKLETIVDPQNPLTLWVQAGIAVGVMALYALAVWWVLGVNHRVNDFMIATEGEMKKVNWSTKQEVIGATKVGIVMVLALAALLFVVDSVFAVFFTKIGVLKVPSLFG